MRRENRLVVVPWRVHSALSTHSHKSVSTQKYESKNRPQICLQHLNYPSKVTTHRQNFLQAADESDVNDWVFIQTDRIQLQFVVKFAHGCVQLIRNIVNKQVVKHYSENNSFFLCLVPLAPVTGRGWAGSDPSCWRGRGTTWKHCTISCCGDAEMDFNIKQMYFHHINNTADKE